MFLNSNDFFVRKDKSIFEKKPQISMKNSARGDKIDFAGKYPQLRIFVDKVYQLLISRKLEWMKIGDPEAGIADDIQYSTKDCVHAYQMKWSVQEKKPSFSYNDFRNLLKDLIDSWKSIKKQNIGKKVIIYIITNQQPSKNDTIKFEGSKIGSFSDFLSKYYDKVKENSSITIEWKNHIETEVRLLGIDKNDFYEFIHDFEFKFNQSIPSYEDNEHYPIIKNDHNEFLNFICSEYYKRESRITFSENELRQMLQLDSRSKTIFFHDFFVDLDLYKPNTTTIEVLNTSIKTLNSGYIFLNGKPGTGKSTLLTEWIKTRKERVIRYYAYSNNSIYTPTRGDGKNLFFDLVIQIQENGFYNEKVYPYQANIEQTQAIFYKQLKLLNEDFKKTDIKTIIVIDGLDHIPREYNTQDSLIKYLPDPFSIPEGVIFVLGSQTFDFQELPNSIIHYSKKSPERTITISPLTKTTVEQIISKFSIFDNAIIEKIYQISEGHPLYLSYVLKQLQDSTNHVELLKKFEPLGDNIEEYYENMWRKYQGNFKIIQILGLIVRLRFGFDERMVNEWSIEADEQRELKKILRQFFDKSFDTWTIFHNSFRQFLLHKTAEGAFSEEFESNIHIDFHNKLSQKSIESNIQIFKFERLYHLFEAHQFDTFIKEATPEYFLNQIETSRPFAFIKGDLKMGLTIASQKQSVSLLLKYGFLSSEVSRREWNFGQDKLFPFFPKILDKDVLTQYVFLSDSEIITQEVKLKLSRAYYLNGQISEAKLLFRIAQPIEIKEDGIVFNPENRERFASELDDLLKEWVCTAHYFLSVTNVLDKILQLRTEGKREDRKNDRDEDSRKRGMLIFALLDYLIDQKENEKILDFIDYPDFKEKKREKPYFTILERAISHFIENNDALNSSKILTIILDNFNEKQLSNSQRIQVAFMIFTIKNDFKDVNKWMLNVTMPEIKMMSFSEEVNFEDEMGVFKFMQLKQFLGHSFSLNSLFPYQNNNKNRATTEYKRLFYFIFQIQRDGQDGLIIDIKSVLPIIRLFYQKYDYRNRELRDISNKKYHVFSLLIDVLSGFGISVLEKFWQLLKNEFVLYPDFWRNSSHKIDIVNHLHDKGLKIEYVKEVLVELETSVLNASGSLDDRITQSLSLCSNWLKINDIEKAKYWIKNAQKESLGVGNRKDNQLKAWMKWFQKINEIETDKAYERINWLNSINEHVQQTTENAGYDISEPLLEALLNINLSDGLTMIKWQVENGSGGLIEYIDSLSQFIISALSKANQDELFLLLDIWGKLFIFTHQYSHVYLLEKLITRGKDVFDDKAYQNFEGQILYYLSINTISEHRQEYYEFLKSINVKVNTDFKILLENEELEKENILYLTDNRIIKENNVISSIKNFDDFWQLFIYQSFAYSQKFNWYNTIESIEYLIDEKRIKLIISFLIENSRDIETQLLFISKFCLKNKYYSGVKDICHYLLSKERSSWIPYNGGQRLEAHKLLVQIGEENARKNAFSDFAEKLSNYSALELLPLDDILDIIAPNYQVSEVWNEIEEYLKRLLATAEKADSLPVFTRQHKSLDYIVADLLLYYINQQALTISQPSTLIYINHLSVGKEGFIEKLKEYCAVNTIKNQINASHILTCVSAINIEITKNFYDEIKRLKKSILYSVSNAAKDLLYEIWDEYEQEVSAFEFDYNWNTYIKELQLLDSHKNNSTIIFADYTLKKELILKEVNHCVKFLSKISRLNENIWENKIFKLIVNLSYNPDYKEIVAKKKDVFNVDFRDIIQEAVITDIVIDILLKELVDLGFYGQEEIFKFFIHPIDRNYHQIKASPKPSFINGIINEGLNSHSTTYYLKKDWYLQVNESIMKYKFEFDEFYVIAESTTIRGLGWELESEERNAFLSKFSVKESDLKEHSYSFEILYDTLLEDYLYQDVTNKDLILFNAHKFTHRCPEKILNWLAFNPEIAIQLGWSYDEEGLFKWVDKNGKVMVESIYWTNGNSCLKPPHLKSESGSGWIILASKPAFNQLREIFNLSLCTIFTRTQNIDNDLNFKTAKSIVKIKND